MLPKLHYISQGKTPEDHLLNIKNACINGAELVQLRLKDVPNAEVLKIAEEAREMTTSHDTKLIINDHYQIAKAVKADGVHLGKNDACPTTARAVLYDWQIIGGTANTLEDCRALINKNVDYIGLGPFRFTTTKDKLSPIVGVDGYRNIIGALKTETPIIAIGGITLSDVSEILETGIYGIAASGVLTKDFNQIEQFKRLLQGSTSQAQV